MRNMLRAILPERVRPALALVKEKAADGKSVLPKMSLLACDVAAAIGLDPHKSAHQLWLEKTEKQRQLSAMNASNDTGPAFWRTLLEPLVASVYAKRTGYKMRRVNQPCRHPVHDWMAATLVWEVVGSEEVQILECLGVGAGEMLLWQAGLPAYIRVNILHLLAVTGKQAADVAVLICGQELRIYRVERDEAHISQLIDLEHSFCFGGSGLEVDAVETPQLGLCLSNH